MQSDNSQTRSIRASAGPTIAQRIGRMLLGAFLVAAGVSHVTVNRTAFLAQVPEWLPLPGDLVVVASGIVEIVLGLALLVLPRYRVPVGWVVAAFFVAIFPGNVSQFVTDTDSFGLNSPLSRGIRLLFQPLLIVWALWSTGAWTAWRARRHATHRVAGEGRGSDGATPDSR